VKFICPICKSEEQVEVVMKEVVASCKIDFSDPSEIRYDYPTLHESVNDFYQCAACGWKLPIEPDAIGEDKLIDWLFDQEYNHKKATVAIGGTKMDHNVLCEYYLDGEEITIVDSWLIRNGRRRKINLEGYYYQVALDGLSGFVNRG